MEDQITVKFFHVESERNSGIILVFGAWPARILKHRGWKNEIYRRVMTDDEIEHVSNCYRYVAIKYKNLADLLADEVNYVSKAQFEVCRFVLDEYFNK
jgi:hypothetical protein